MLLALCGENWGADGERLAAVVSEEIGASRVLLRVWELRASAPGHHRADEILTLPASSGKYRLLIILPEGAPLPYSGEEDLMQEYEQYR